MSVALALVVHNYDNAKQALQDELKQFNRITPGFPVTVTRFRQLYPTFTRNTVVGNLQQSNKEKERTRSSLVDAYRAVAAHEHCFKLLSVPSILKNICFLLTEDFTELQIAAHPSQNLLNEANIYPRLRHCEPEVAKELAFTLISFNRPFSIQRMDEVHRVSAVF